MIKNTAGQKLVVFAYDTLNQAVMTGDAANITAKISKDGAAYVATNDVNPTEIERGRYAFDLTQAETNCDRWHVVPHSVTAGVVVVCEETCFTTEVRPSNSDITAIKAKTDLLTFTGADVRATLDGEAVSIANSGIAESSFVKGAISSEVIATDAFGALELAAGAASEIATAVRTELATELGRIDVATSTRLSAASSFSTNVTETPTPSRIMAFVGETRTFTITTVDGLGNAVDCSAMTLEVVIEKLDRTDVVTIADANITKTSTTVSFSVASTYHTTEANYRWALRRTDTGVVIMFGPYVVDYAADN